MCVCGREGLPGVLGGEFHSINFIDIVGGAPGQRLGGVRRFCFFVCFGGVLLVVCRICQYLFACVLRFRGKRSRM